MTQTHAEVANFRESGFRCSSPTISVVIPAYNCAHTIVAAIESAANQTVAPDEIIVVDDGSRDETFAVASRFSPGVRVLRQSNQGSSVARQAGTDSAASEYIAYLDADDWWPEKKLEDCVSVLAQDDVHLLMGDFQRARPGTEPDDDSPRNSSFFPWAQDFLLEHSTPVGIGDLFRLDCDQALQLLFDGFPVFPSVCVMRRSTVIDVGGWDRRFRRCQDFDLGLRMARRAALHWRPRIHAIVGLHPQNEDGFSYVVNQSYGDIAVLEAHFNSAPAGSKYQQRVARAIAAKHCSLGYNFRCVGRFQEAGRAYREALRWPGRRLHSAFRWVHSTSRAFLQQNFNRGNK